MYINISIINQSNPIAASHQNRNRTLRCCCFFFVFVFFFCFVPFFFVVVVVAAKVRRADSGWDSGLRLALRRYGGGG